MTKLIKRIILLIVVITISSCTLLRKHYDFTTIRSNLATINNNSRFLDTAIFNKYIKLVESNNKILELSDTTKGENRKIFARQYNYELVEYDRAGKRIKLVVISAINLIQRYS